MGKKTTTKQETWPNGETIDAWFSDTLSTDIQRLGKRFVVTDYGVEANSTAVQTKALQAVIDRAANEGGGVIVIQSS